MGQIRKRAQNRGLRKICDCPRRTWAKCPHSWHFNFKPKGGPSFRFSVDSEAGKHIEYKTDAETLAESWRSQIRAGTFRRTADQVKPSPHVTFDVMTLAKFGETYVERVGKPVSANTRTCLAQLVAFTANNVRLGDKPLTAITEDDLEAFLAKARSDEKAASTRNKYIQTTKALFRWAVKKGYLTRNPAGDSEALKREQHARRDRRLEDGEEGNILEHAGTHLQRLIIAALESAQRRVAVPNMAGREPRSARDDDSSRTHENRDRSSDPDLGAAGRDPGARQDRSDREALRGGQVRLR